MAILLYRTPEGQLSELPLKPGVNRLGRSEMNDVRVPDGSVSSNHCELRLDGEQIFVRDLGSTNGTSIDQAPVQQGLLLPGHTLRVGNVELVFQGDAEPKDLPGLQTPPPPPVPIPIPNVLPDGAALCKRHPNLPAQWRCSKCGEQYCDKCVVDGRKFGVTGVKFCPSCHSKVDSLKAQAEEKKKASKTFGGEMAAALKYPFRGEGAIILVAGSVFFALASFALVRLFLLAIMIFVGTVGYLMAYSQKVIQSSAQGEDDPPGWPDLSDYLQDLVIPFMQATGLFIAYLLPYWLTFVFMFSDELSFKVLHEGVLLLAVFMMPMAWLAISMHESIVGLSPHFVIPSIVRIFGHYILLFLILYVVVRANIFVEELIDRAAIPIFGRLVSAFVNIYFLTVISRMLGIAYFINRKKLQWF